MPLPSASALPPNETPGAGAWTQDPAEPLDGPGLLVSPAFWVGGLVSLTLWAALVQMAASWI